jgi:hypothetical protein
MMTWKGFGMKLGGLKEALSWNLHGGTEDNRETHLSE